MTVKGQLCDLQVVGHVIQQLAYVDGSNKTPARCMASFPAGCDGVGLDGCHMHAWNHFYCTLTYKTLTEASCGDTTAYTSKLHSLLARSTLQHRTTPETSMLIANVLR